jgi:hypothetical protein
MNLQSARKGFVSSKKVPEIFFFDLIIQSNNYLCYTIFNWLPYNNEGTFLRLQLEGATGKISQFKMPLDDIYKKLVFW